MEFWALEAAGVDNLSGYEFAVEQAEKDGYNWNELTDELKVNYLENECLDNWKDLDYAKEILEAEEIFEG